MLANISPSMVNGTIKIPPSKSMSHRAIICAALSKGKSIISNISYSQDVIATIEGMKKLGAQIQQFDNYVEIIGIQDFNHLQDSNIFANESGSTLRFFIPIFSLCNQPITFSGAGRLMQRPQSIYEKLFHEKGLTFKQDSNGIQIKESLIPGKYELKGDVSSQFISGLLFALPLLNNDSIIAIKPPFESRSYVDLTIQMLSYFNVNVYYQDENTIVIPGNQHYESCNYRIEGDYSQLAFFAVLAAINNDLTILGVNHDSKQGDQAIIDILKDFNIKVEEVEHGYKVYKGDLIAHDIDLGNCPDLGPILCVLAMYSKGKTTIYNAGRLRIKESDRIAAMEEELHKFGVDITSSNDEIYINGNDNYTCKEMLNSHNDHRIVMALSVALACSNSDGSINQAQAISKSYPNFFEDFSSIKGKVVINYD